MVSTAALVSGGFGFLSLVATVTVLAVGDPKEQYQDVVLELQEERIDELSEAVGPAVVSLLQDLTDDESDVNPADAADVGKPEQVDISDHVVALLSRKLTEVGDISEIHETVEAVAEPRQKYNEARERYNATLNSLYVAMLGSAGIFILIAIGWWGNLSGNEQFVIASFPAVAGLSAIHSANQQRIQQNWLDERDDEETLY